MKAKVLRCSGTHAMDEAKGLFWGCGETKAICRERQKERGKGIAER